MKAIPAWLYSSNEATRPERNCNADCPQAENNAIPPMPACKAKAHPTVRQLMTARLEDTNHAKANSATTPIKLFINFPCLIGSFERHAITD